MIRVAITGIGIISPFGKGKAAALTALRAGNSGIRRITSIDASELNCKIGGEVPVDDSPQRGYDRFTRFALVAAAEAAQQAKLASIGVDPDRIGVLVGTGLGGCETLDAGYRRVYKESQARIPPASIAMSMYNAAASAISTKYQARGISYAVVSACASSAHAIGLAYQAIRSGQADAMITGGADAPLTFGIIRAWESMRVLAVDNDHPERACRPFSADRKGLVLAEGAGIFILESFDAALRRGRLRGRKNPNPVLRSASVPGRSGGRGNS